MTENSKFRYCMIRVADDPGQEKLQAQALPVHEFVAFLVSCAAASRGASGGRFRMARAFWQGSSPAANSRQTVGRVSWIEQSFSVLRKQHDS